MGEQSFPISDELSFEDRYYDLVVSNMGTFEQFNHSYSIHHDQIIGRGTERIVYHGTDRQNEGNVAIHQITIESKTKLILYFAKYLTIQKCNFYNQLIAFLAPIT